MEANGALRPGTILRSPHGEYVIIKILGQGGFGITYLVESSVRVGNIDVKVNLAVKEHFISSMCGRETDSQMVQFSEPVADTVNKSLNSFIKEAKRVQELGVESPNIIKFNEVFEANNTAYYVMEYLNGVTLEQFVQQRGRLSGEEAETLLRPIAEAVSILHTKKLTHYDIKPQNIIITTNEDGILRPVLIDFGLSKHYDSGGAATSMIDMVGFSRGYAPVEQYYGLTEFTPEADVYALGATLYFCLTGQNPEDAAVFHPEEKLKESGVTVPDKMKKGMLHALSISKRDRTQDAGQFVTETFNTKLKSSKQSSTATQVAHAVTEIWKGAQQHPATMVSAPASNQYAKPSDVSQGKPNSAVASSAKVAKPKRKKTGLYIGLGVAALLVIGGIVTWIVLSSKGDGTQKKAAADVKVTMGLAEAMLRYDEVEDFHDGLAVVVKYNHNYKDLEYWEIRGKYGYINTAGDEVVPCIYDWVHSASYMDFHEGLAPVRIGEKYGYIDTSGNVAIPARYDDAYSFSEGLAFVALQIDDNYNYRYFFIDKEGKEVVSLIGEPYYQGEGGPAFTEFHDGLLAIYQNEKFGFMNKEGEMVVPCVYDEVYDFHDGHAAVRIGDLWGFIDTTGKQVINVQYIWVEEFSEGMAAVQQNQCWGFVDAEGKMIIHPVYTQVGPFSEGVAKVATGRWPKYSVGFVDKTGQIVIPMNFEAANNFSEGLAPVGGKKYPNDDYVNIWGFINKKGEVVVPMTYSHAYEFSEGLARVSYFFNENDSTSYGFVDKYGTSTFDLLQSVQNK